MIPRKVYGCLELQKIVSKMFDFRIFFLNSQKNVFPQHFFYCFIEEKMLKD